VKRYLVVLLLLSSAGALALLGGTGSSQHVARAFDPTKAPEIQDRLLDGLADFELKPSGDMQGSGKLSNYTASKNDGCGVKDANNVKVNQNCLNVTDSDLQGRGQAQNETSISIDPSNKQNVVSSFNDYRRGDGNCYASWSSDGGKSWYDSTAPMSFTRGTLYGAARQYWQAGGDTSVAWDTKGNAYLSCQMFMRGPGVTPNPDLSSAFFVFRSTGNGGASWNFPGRPVVQSPDPTGTGTADFLDKQLLTVDDHVGSPFQDRVYVTWTTFTASGTAYIYEAWSNDYAEHFSAPVLVSKDSTLCANSFGQPTPNGHCNENQFSQPFTGPDGALYVAWANFNNAVTGTDNRNQILLAKSTDGGVTFSSPVKVGDYYDLPDCDTYQGAGADPGRACVPEKTPAGGTPTSHSLFRATNYPSGAVNPNAPSTVVVTYGSYINSASKETNGCAPAGFASNGDNKFTGVKTPGACNNKILISVSTDGGTHFTGGAAGADPRTQSTVNGPSQNGTDQWWQWAAFGTGKNARLAVSYYDRQYGDDESTGYSDFSISGSSDLSSFGQKRVTTDSMPPPTQFSGQFLGDYTGLDAADQALPIWADTRAPDLFLCPGTGTPTTPPDVCTGTESAGYQAGLTANDEDIFTASVPIPNK
jgi:hypothetical protein